MMNFVVQSDTCAIESAKLSGYENNPLKMLYAMELKLNQIKDLSGGKDPFDEENDIDIYSISKSVQTHYIDLVDPKDAAIIAQTMKLKNQGDLTLIKKVLDHQGATTIKRQKKIKQQTK
eukprot:15364341-Ditylum_brightwellii.AAC.1